MRNAVDRELSSALPRYDAKPARFALNQGSRKLCSGGVTRPGLIRCAGLEYIDTAKNLRKLKVFEDKYLALRHTG